MSSILLAPCVRLSLALKTRTMSTKMTFIAITTTLRDLRRNVLGVTAQS